MGVAVDSAGAAYVTANTISTDFPTTPGAFDTTGGFSDVFVTKLNPAGSGLSYSTFLGGGGFDQSHGVAVDSAGAAYVTGITVSGDFPTTAGAFDTSANDGFPGDAFVTKLNPAGSGLSYSTYLGGSDPDLGFGVAVDSAGAAYVTGETGSANFPTTAGAFDTSPTSRDSFVTKLNPAGSGLSYSTYLGPTGTPRAAAGSRSTRRGPPTSPGSPPMGAPPPPPGPSTPAPTATPTRSSQSSIPPARALATRPSSAGPP